jgi:hypothetical protein
MLGFLQILAYLIIFELSINLTKITQNALVFIISEEKATSVYDFHKFVHMDIFLWS